MKKIITVFAFAFFVSQLCVAQQATMLENSEYPEKTIYGRSFWAVNNEQAFYKYGQYNSKEGWSYYFKVLGENGKLEDWAAKTPPKEAQENSINQPYNFYFNDNIFMTYEVSSQKSIMLLQSSYGKKFNYKQYAVEWAKSEKPITENSILLNKKQITVRDSNYKFIYLSFIENSIDSNELAVFNRGHLKIFDKNFEVVKDIRIDFSWLIDKKWVLDRFIFTGDKLISVIDDYGIGSSINSNKVWVYDINIGKSKIIDIPTTKKIVFDKIRIAKTSNEGGGLSYRTDANYCYKNGILYMFGRLSDANAVNINSSDYVKGLAYLNIDIDKGTCKVKYLNGTGNNIHSANTFSTMALKFCDDGV